MQTALEQLTKTSNAAVEAALGIANDAFTTAEKINALNFSVARSALEEFAANSRALLGIKDMQELMTTQSSLAKPSLDQTFAYSRSLYEIVSEHQERLRRVVEEQFAAANMNVSNALDSMTTSATPGSDAAIAAVKSAIAAANATYEAMTKVARQATTITKANAAAATGVKAESVAQTRKGARKAA